jgi:hypothetical protein
MIHNGVPVRPAHRSDTQAAQASDDTGNTDFSVDHCRVSIPIRYGHSTPLHTITEQHSRGALCTGSRPKSDSSSTCVDECSSSNTTDIEETEVQRLLPLRPQESLSLDDTNLDNFSKYCNRPASDSGKPDIRAYFFGTHNTSQQTSGPSRSAYFQQQRGLNSVQNLPLLLRQQQQDGAEASKELADHRTRFRFARESQSLVYQQLSSSSREDKLRCRACSRPVGHRWSLWSSIRGGEKRLGRERGWCSRCAVRKIAWSALCCDYTGL